MGQYSWMANSISIAQFAIMFITPFLMAKFGKRWMYAAGMALLTLGFAGFGLFGTSKSIMIVCNVLKGCGLGISGAGFKGEYDRQCIAQPASVETAIRFMYNWVPMVMCAIICVIFVVSFNLDRDLAKLCAEKGIEG